jgi:Tfp pilus assembly protein PilN
MRAINLIPPEQRRGAGGLAGRTGGVVYVIVATLIAVVALGVIYVFAVHSVATRKATLAQVTAQAAAVNAQVSALQPYVTFESLSKQRVEGVATLAQQRFDWPDAMQQLALALPAGVHLQSLSGSATGGGTGASGTTGTSGSTGATSQPATSVSAPTLTLSGCAPSQDVVALTLARLRQLRNVSGATVSSYDKSAGCGVSFDMTVTYDSSYAIPVGTLKAGPHSTVGG